jgi:hypothetical protein
MRGALSSCLTDPEPPIALDVKDVMRRGRRRQRVHRAIPLAAAAVTVLALTVPWSLSTRTPDSGQVPMIGGAPPAGAADTTQPTPPPNLVSPNQQTATVPPARTPSPGTSAPSGGAPIVEPPAAQPAHRAPAGHAQDKDGDALAKTIVDRLPAGRTADYFGTRSATMVGARYGWGFHILWQDSGRYGYFLWLHRTKGAFPATIYGLPAEPCAEPADRLPAYHCAPVTVTNGSAMSFDVDAGDYLMRGIVWDQKDPAGGADMRVTVAFALPSQSAWTPFSKLDTAPRLDTIPMSIQDIAKLMDVK